MHPRANAALALYVSRLVEALEKREHLQTLEFERLWIDVLTLAPSGEAALRALESDYPRISQPRLHVVRASGSAATYGIENRSIEGVDVHITSPAKTVADCFRYRDHVGLDVAIAALRDYRRKGRGQPTSLEHSLLGAGSGFGYGAGAGAGNGDGSGYGDPWFYSIDALVEAARADRVYSVLRPYLEALA